MMETLKRHAFLVILVGGVVVIAAATLLLVYFLYTRPAASTKADLVSTDRRAKELLTGNVFTAKQVEKMGLDVTARQKQYEELLTHLRNLGADRAPLVKDVFPQGNDIARHTFKAAYDPELAKFMKRLGAIKPVTATAENKPEAEANLKATMFVDPKISFFRPDWVDKQEAPDMALIRAGQENLWLMQDVVEVIAGLNDSILKKMSEGVKAGDPKIEPVIANAPVKELVEIRIGGDYAVLAGSKMSAIQGRYRPTPAAARGIPAAKGEGGRAPTLSGRYTQPRFYQVLPFRLIVVIDARYAGDLVRRMQDSETFLSVEAWRVRPINETTFERGAKDLLANAREDYGPHAVVRLEMVAESLAWQLEGGRATVVAEKKAPTPAAKGAAGKAE